MREHVLVPTVRNLRFQRRLAMAAILAGLCLTMVALAALVTGESGRRSPAGLMIGAIFFVPFIVRMRAAAHRLEAQVAQLASRGQRYPAHDVRVERMRRGKVTHFHVVVALFRDRNGVPTEALSDTFTYDPSPLLGARPRLEVIADPFEPALCVIASDTLPARHRWRLPPGQRALLGPVNPLVVALWSLLWIMLAVLVWNVARLVA